MEIPIFVHQWLTDDGKAIITSVNTYDTSEYCKGQVLIYLGTVSVPSLTINDLLPAHIAELRKKQGGLQAEINEIEGNIQSLFCIEHKPLETEPF